MKYLIHHFPTPSKLFLYQEIKTQPQSWTEDFSSADKVPIRSQKELLEKAQDYMHQKNQRGEFLFSPTQNISKSRVYLYDPKSKKVLLATPSELGIPLQNAGELRQYYKKILEFSASNPSETTQKKLTHLSQNIKAPLPSLEKLNQEDWRIIRAQKQILEKALDYLKKFPAEQRIGHSQVYLYDPHKKSVILTQPSSINPSLQKVAHLRDYYLTLLKNIDQIPIPPTLKEYNEIMESWEKEAQKKAQKDIYDWKKAEKELPKMQKEAREKVQELKRKWEKTRDPQDKEFYLFFQEIDDFYQDLPQLNRQQKRELKSQIHEMENKLIKIENFVKKNGNILLDEKLKKEFLQDHSKESEIEQNPKDEGEAFAVIIVNIFKQLTQKSSIYPKDIWIHFRSQILLIKSF